MANFYDQYVKPYITSAAQTAAINLAAEQFVNRGMSQEEAYKAAYQVVTGQTLPTVPTSFFDKEIFGIKMPVIIVGAIGAFLIFGVIQGRK